MNIYVEELILKEDYHGFKPKTFKFKPGINLIVGENGAGKSTLLKLVGDHNNKVKKEIKLTPETITNGVETAYFDTEKDNPRMQDTQYAKDVGYVLQSHFVSHGESLLPIILAIKDRKNTVIFIDEPESALSLKNQLKILKSIKTAEKNGCQIFIATHSYILIKNMKTVFDVSIGDWITSEEFLKDVNI